MDAGAWGERAELADVVPSHGVPLHVGHSSIRKAVGWARRSGKPAFPSTVCWAGPAGFRVEPTVRRRLSRGASVVALAKFGREFFSSQACWPVGFAFDGVLG